MGMIRKTLSVATFGTVSFRSKKEKLRRAERAQRDVELMLEREHEARVKAETRSGAAEKRLRRADRRNRRRRASETLAEKFVAAEPAIHRGIESAADAGSNAAARSRRAGRRAQKSARRAMHQTAVAASAAKDAAAPHLQAAASHAAEAVDRITSS